MHKDHQRRLWRPQIHHQCETVCQVCGRPEWSGRPHWHWGGHESRVRQKCYLNVLSIQLKAALMTAISRGNLLNWVPFVSFLCACSVDRNKYQIHIPLPPKIDPTVTMMQVWIYPVIRTPWRNLWNHLAFMLQSSFCQQLSWSNKFKCSYIVGWGEAWCHLQWCWWM